jgi:hypothetical protein
MAIRQLTDNLSIISALADEPNDTQGLSADALKAKFDEGGNKVKSYVNSVLIPDVSEAIADAVSAAELANGNMPLGGTAGQVLSKRSAADFDAAFLDVSDILTPDALPVSSAVSAQLGLTVSDGQHVDGALKKLAGAAGNYRGTCSTAEATAAKTVSISGFTLAAGVTVCVTFTYANTAAAPTLNVTGTGAKAVYYAGAAVDNGRISAGLTALLQYDGTRWVMLTPGIKNLLEGTIVNGSVTGVAYTAETAVTLGAAPKRLILSVGSAGSYLRSPPYILFQTEPSVTYLTYVFITGTAAQMYITVNSDGFSLRWGSNQGTNSYIIYYEATV